MKIELAPVSKIHDAPEIELFGSAREIANKVVARPQKLVKIKPKPMIQSLKRLRESKTTRPNQRTSIHTFFASVQQCYPAHCHRDQEVM